jgi:CheY-like chemotaxis protein
LIVDDNADQGKPLALILRHCGFDAQFVTSGPAALSRLREQVPGLLIVDLMMPGMTGIDVLREVRTDPRTRGVPVVIYSACSDEKEMARARREGADDYWVKVATRIDEIRRRVEHYFTGANGAAHPAH